MKRKFLRALALACFSLVATGAFVTAGPAYASGDKAPQVSRAAGKALTEARKLIDAKDYAGAVAALQQAVSAGDLKDYDKYIINTYLGIAYFQSGDQAKAGDAFVAASEVPNMRDSDHQEAVEKALMLLSATNDYGKVIAFVEKDVPANAALSENLLTMIGICYYNTKHDQQALDYAKRAIAAATAKNAIPQRDTYQLLLSAQNHMKDMAGEIATIQTMAGLYGTAEDWSRAIDVAVGSLPAANKNSRTVAAFFLYRRRMEVGAATSADDYELAAELATDQNSPGDVIKVANQAKAHGKTTKKLNAILAKALGDARKDKASLAAADAAAAKSANGTLDVSVAEGYYGYGMFADAERVAARAVAKGGAKKNEALMILGASQTLLGKNAEAAATFAKVKGDAALEKAAGCWTVYATRKYGKTAAAAPAAN